jgi:hypothetical protein
MASYAAWISCEGMGETLRAWLPSLIGGTPQAACGETLSDEAEFINGLVPIDGGRSPGY